MDLNRRGFLGLLGGAGVGIALEQAIPFGRVWSFPTKIKPIAYDQVFYGRPHLLTVDWVTEETLRALTDQIRFSDRLDVLYGFSGLPEES